MSKELDNCIFTWEHRKRRSGSLNAQIWHLVQSSNTQAENLEHDFNEIVAKSKSWAEVTRYWVEKKKKKRRKKKKKKKKKRTPEGGMTAAGGAMRAVMRWSFLPSKPVSLVKISCLSNGEKLSFLLPTGSPSRTCSSCMSFLRLRTNSRFV